MNLITIIMYVTAALTMLVLALMAGVVILNTVSEQRIAWNNFLRSRMLPILQEYLAGRESGEAVLHELKRDREMALECLVETASGLPPGERQRLRPFFEPFKFEDELLDEVRGWNPVKCIHAATRLGFTGNRENIPALVQALSDDMLDVRLAAARALAQLGATETVAQILRALALPGTLPQQNTTEIIYGMGQGAIEPLLTFLRANRKNGEASTLAVAVRVLGLLKATEAAPEIMALLNHPDSEVRLNSARALGLIGTHKAVVALCQRAGDTVWEVRSSAVQALGRIKDAMSIPILTRALGDQAWWVRFNAAQALFELGEAGIDALKNTLAINPDAFARDISRQIMEEHGVIAT